MEGKILSSQKSSLYESYDFFTYEDEDQMQFIADSAWEPLEHNSPEDVYSLIDSLTYDVQLIMKKGI